MIMMMPIKMDNNNYQHDDYSNVCDNGNNDYHDYHNDNDHDHHDNDNNDDENLRYLRWVPALPDGTSLSLTSAFKEDKI